MLTYLRNRILWIKSKLSVNNSAMDRWMGMIETSMSVFGVNTFSEGWRIGPVGVSTAMLIGVSLVADTGKFATMINNLTKWERMEVVEGFVFILTQSIALYRIIILVRYKDSFRAIVHKLKVEFAPWITDDKDQRMMDGKTRRWMTVFWFGISSVVINSTFILIKCTKNHSLPLPMSGFVFPYVDNQQTPYYEILFFIQMWSITSQIIVATGWHNMFCSLCVLAASHLEILGLTLRDEETKKNRGSIEENQEIADIRSSIQNVRMTRSYLEAKDEAGIIDDEIKQSRSFETEDQAENFSEFIEKHNKIHQAVLELEDIYGFILGLLPLYAGLGIIASTLLYDGSQQSNFFLQISIDHMAEMYIYCYFGQMISDASTALGFRIYSTSWYKKSTSQKRATLQMMHRAQKPIALKAGMFGPLTMEMYSKSMQMTYSIWTVFNRRAAKSLYK